MKLVATGAEFAVPEKQKRESTAASSISFSAAICFFLKKWMLGDMTKLEEMAFEFIQTDLGLDYEMGPNQRLVICFILSKTKDW